MRVYQAADGRWIFWDGETKTYYDTKAEAEMAESEIEKKQSYIEDVRQFVRDYGAMMARAQALGGQWSALLSTIITEDDMPGGIVSDGTSRLSAFTSVIGNMATLVTTYDAGLDTNFERVA